MRFIRLSTLKQQFPSFHFPIKEADYESFRNAFYASEWASHNSIPENEQWLINLQSEEFVLFLDWTEQERNLAATLDEKGRLEPFQNSTNVINHALFPKFQAFISPFLYRRLNTCLQQSNMDVWLMGMSYLVLLNEREADLIQTTVFGQLWQQHDALNQAIDIAKSEGQLLDLIRKHLTSKTIEVVNLSTISFYRSKTSWVETLIRVSHHPHSSRRLVLFIIQELNKLKLNADHMTELREMEQLIKSNQLQVEKDSGISKRVFLVALSVCALVGLIWFIWWLPTEPEPETQQEQTSYMDFTPEERATMDSLLREIKYEQKRESNNQLDHPDMDYVGEDLIVNIPWNNQLAESLISQWRQKDSTGRTPQSSESKKDSRAFPSTDHFSDKTGIISAKFQNDTQLSVFILVFKDRADEWVYSGYVEKGGVITIKLNPGEQLFVLPGSKVPKNIDYSGLPFHQVDSRFFQCLEKPYTVDDFSPSKVKLVWKALNNYDFYLLDVNGALKV